MNPHDHAVVVGIGRYRGARDPSGWIRDLHGPANDANAIAAWLRKPSGGGLPRGNVTVVTSSEAGRPEQQEVEAALSALSQLPPSTPDGYAGRRLYLYVSGHGLANRADEAALITAEAEEYRTLNVLITSWLEWFYTATSFKEYVLWVDCCMQRQPLARLKACDLNERVGQGDKGKRFVAYAAPFGKAAIERKMPDGKVHGVFTYTLLQGLKNAGAGEVTSEHLRQYLLSNMRSFMSEEDLIPAVADEPGFGVTDNLTFHAPKRKRRLPVTLHFPDDAIGKKATVSANASKLAAETVLEQADWTVKLPAGSYVAFVPELNRFTAFTISGGGSDGVVTVS